MSCRGRTVRVLDEPLPPPFPLDRPLVFLDLETTSEDPTTARVVELGIVKIDPFGGPAKATTYRFNPGEPIPADATAVHGITDAEVEGLARFDAFASEILLALDFCDLGGFNILRFDLPVLQEEFGRCGMALDVSGRMLFDAMAIFHRMEPRDLAAAHRLYVGRDMEDQHEATADAVAAARVLFAQVHHYPNLADDPKALHRWIQQDRPYLDVLSQWWDTTPAKRVDWVFRRGKHEGKTLAEVAHRHRDYLKWMAYKAEAMSGQVRAVVRAFL